MNRFKTITSLAVVFFGMLILAIPASHSQEKREQKEGSDTAVVKTIPGIKHGKPLDGLAAFLRCEKKRFKVGQSIPLFYGVVRAGTQQQGQQISPLKIVRPYIANAPRNASWFSVTGPDGREVPFRGLALQLGVQPEDVILLRQYEFHGRMLPELRWSYQIKSPGTYRVKWHYWGGCLNGGIWIGNIVSNEIHFEIVK